MAQLVGHPPAERKAAGSIPITAHAWVVGLVPDWGVYERQPIDVSLSLSLSLSLVLSLKINK